MYTPLAFPVSPQQHQALVNFIAKKVTFDKSAHQSAESEEEKKAVESKLLEATYLYQWLGATPQKMSFSLVRRIRAYLEDAKKTYQHMRQWLAASADKDTRGLDLEIAKAEILHQVLCELIGSPIGK